MEWTVFRIYGTFAWPPLPEMPFSETGKTEDGTVEFGYADLPVPLGRQPFVRWVPYDTEPVPVTGADKNIASFDSADRDALQSGSSKPFAYLLGKIDPLEATPLPAYLRFRGAAVFEQCQEKETPGQEYKKPGEPMMRWLLARTYWRDGELETSEVLVGIGGDKPKQNGSSFAFAFALPTPLPRSIGSDQDSNVFPFIARYRPARTAFDPAKPLDTFSVASGTFSAGDVAATLSALNPPLHANYLGGFGFCRSDGAKDALYLPRIKHFADSTVPDEPSTRMEERTRRQSRDKLWLSDEEKIAKTLLGPLLSSHPDIADKITAIATDTKQPTGTQISFSYETTAGGEKRNSIYFSGEPDGSRTVIRFRHAIEATGGFSKAPLRISSGNFTFVVPELDGALLPSSSSILIIEFTLEYSIPNGAIWDAVRGTGRSTGKSFPEIDLTVMCGFKGKSTNFAAATVDRNSLGAAALFEVPTAALALTREALRRTDGAQPDSILPDIVFGPRTEFRLAYAPALDVVLDRSNGVRLVWKASETGAQTRLGRLTLWPGRVVSTGHASDAAPLFGNEAAALPINLSFPGFQLGKAKTIGASLVYDKAALGRMGHEAHPISLRIVPAANTDTLDARLGGLGFKLAAPVLRDETQTNLAGETGDDYSVWRFDAGDPFASPTGESSHAIRLRFDASAIDPLAPDTLRGDRSGRPRPVLLPLGPEASKDASEGVVPAETKAASLYVIDMRETIGARTDRFLAADVIDLRGDGEVTAADRYVILSEQPFSISRFEALPLKQRGSADKAYVASYSSDTRSWQFKQVSEHYHYAFPPQAIGESMDKPRMLEIHDPRKDVADADLLPFAPRAEGEDNVLPDKRHIVEYRLTPSAEIWIRPSDTEQGFFRPEWATHSLFREAGALGIGAALNAFRGEFLYGMPAGIDLSFERGLAGGARVAEVEALVGRPLGKIASAAVDREISERWGRITTMIARRPERLEFWMRSPGPARAFAPARFTEGVNFVLRDSAVHKPPLVSPLIDPKKSAGPRLRDHGISGGALWPLESALFTQRLLEAPRSSAGTIERIALSPLGGDADQRAEFLAGQLAIISETRGGRVQRHRVEIIGRISVFWHRAKHVVIYERTASPTQQFGPEGGMGTRSRRPILRKVAEFIELIQPLRSYPDDQAADAMTSGFLKAVRFNSKVIAVDSAWSEDIADAGWRIPLWNRHAARQRPSVYPRPDIVTVTAAEGPEDQPVIAQEILDPDNLFFFADSVAGHADTDRWVARAGIDFSKMPAPRHEQQQPDSAAMSERKKGRLPAAPRIPRGHRRFTWQLGPAARKTAINAGRADEPIFAALETISFQRATQLQTVAGKAERARVEGLMERAGKFVSADALGTKLEAFRAAAAHQGDDKALLARASELVTALDDAIAGRHDTKLDDFQALVDGAPRTCDKMLHQVTGGIERQKLLILDMVRSWQSDAARTILKGSPPTREKAAETALLELDKLVGPLLNGAANQMGRIGEGAERAGHAVQDLEAELRDIVAKAQRRLTALKASYDLSKPWSAARVTEIHARLREIRSGLIGDIEIAASDVRSRLATELDGAARRLAVEIGGRVHMILAAATELKALADRQAGAVEDWLATLNRPLARLIAPAGPLDRAQTAIERLPAEHELKAEALALLGKITNRVKEASSIMEGLEADIAAGRIAGDKAVARVQAEVAGKRAEAAEGFAELKRKIETLSEPELADIKTEVLVAENEARQLISHLADMGRMVDALVDETAAAALAGLQALLADTSQIFPLINTLADDVTERLDTVQKQLRPDGEHSLYLLLRKHVLAPAMFDSFAILDEVGVPQVERLQAALDMVGDAVEERIKSFSADAQRELEKFKLEIQALCDTLGTGLQGAITDLEKLGKKLEEQAKVALATLRGAIADAQRLRELADQIRGEAEAARKSLEQSWIGAQAYADNVFHTAGQIGKGDLAAAPGQILRLYAAAASAPELPNLDFARERLGYYYDELNKVIDTTPTEAWFSRLGEELKAMGLALPFDKLGDRLLPGDLSGIEIGKVFRNFGGIDLSRLFKGVNLPKGAKDAIKLTHAFDKKQARAWVQIDINVPLPGRRPLLGVGPFKLDFVEARLDGMLRLETSKDSDTVEQTGRAQILTDIDAVVSGQSMVRLEKLVIHYQKSSGLKVDFDPRNIKINPSLRFIQDTLGQLIPDTAGGLKIVKEQGVPVGVSHDFEMPPISLMAGTSGVSNISISNHFSLIAYPDFVIADRFCLSRPDLPFLFSIFIIGGTGYIMVDVDYRPFSSALMVTVDAAAGGSAALGFAAGPVSGSVFITLSVALSYRKLIGRPGGGLTIACVLLIAGNVDVAGIATVYIGLLLSMNYRENGQIDGIGTLKITIRVSRFFKYTVRRDVNYKLRSGRSGGGGQAFALESGPMRPDPQQVAQDKANKILEARS